MPRLKFPARQHPLAGNNPGHNSWSPPLASVAGGRGAPSEGGAEFVFSRPLSGSGALNSDITRQR